MKPVLLSYLTAGAVCIFLAVITTASPLPPSREAYVLVRRTGTTGKNGKIKKVHWAHPLTKVIPNKHRTTDDGHNQDDSQITSSQLKDNLHTAQKEWISSQTPMPSFILPPDNVHFRAVQGIQHKIEAYESTLRELADSYAKEETFDDERWSRSQIELLQYQRAEVDALVSSDGAHLTYQRSWILPKMLQALKIFLFPVFESKLREHYIRNQAIEQIGYYQSLDIEHLGKSKWIMCDDEFTQEKAERLLTQTMKSIELARAKEEWISSPTPIPCEFAEEELYENEKTFRKIAKTSLKNLLKFVEGEQDSDDEELRTWQTELLISQRETFKEIDETAHYRPSVALQLLLEALKIFLFPVYKQVDSDIKKAAIDKVKYYQKVYKEHNGKTDWETCSAEEGKFTNEEAEQLLKKVEELLKSIPKSEMADKENHH